ncbi:unnamed protein product [Heligmosomoides polygyrus]|uniref:Secreted protein n=1 Tax=Heligmosomoides polygyrus TaxID=6339 RepID=A0A183G1N0_HELPZ|nr:unnamed protein product [Heligmosomoides polygyrus]
MAPRASRLLSLLLTISFCVLHAMEPSLWPALKLSLIARTLIKRKQWRNSHSCDLEDDWDHSLVSRETDTQQANHQQRNNSTRSN